MRIAIHRHRFARKMNISCFTELNYTQISAHFHTCVTASKLITLDTSTSLNQHLYLLVKLLLFDTFANSRWLHVKHSSKLSSTKTNRQHTNIAFRFRRIDDVFSISTFTFLLMKIQQWIEKKFLSGSFMWLNSTMSLRIDWFD